MLEDLLARNDSFLEAGRLALARPQIVKLGLPHFGLAPDFNLQDIGAVQGIGSLHGHTVCRDPAHRVGLSLIHI